MFYPEKKLGDHGVTGDNRLVYLVNIIATDCNYYCDAHWIITAWVGKLLLSGYLLSNWLQSHQNIRLVLNWELANGCENEFKKDSFEDNEVVSDDNSQDDAPFEFDDCIDDDMIE